MVLTQRQSICRRAEASTPLSGAAASQALDKCARQLASRFDSVNGGFGSAPKFPRPCEINALLCDHARASACGATVESRATGPPHQGSGLRSYCHPRVAHALVRRCGTCTDQFSCRLCGP